MSIFLHPKLAAINDAALKKPSKLSSNRRWYGLLQSSQFLLKSREPGLSPLANFSQQMVQGKRVKARIERGQDGHDDTSTLCPLWALTGSAAFANHRFMPDIAFTAVIGRLHLRMGDKDKQRI